MSFTEMRYGPIVLDDDGTPRIAGTRMMDQHVPRAITIGLRLRGVAVLTAFEDGAGNVDDTELLNRASALGPVLFSQDDDLPSSLARLLLSSAAIIAI